jgi:hypothetical protein
MVTVEVALAGPLGARSDHAVLTAADLGGRRATLAFALLVLAGDQPVSATVSSTCSGRTARRPRSAPASARS